MYDPTIERKDFPLNVLDFLADTSHLTPCELGGFIKLLCYCWARNGIPNDIKVMSRLSGLSNSKIKPVLEMFSDNGTHYIYAPMEDIRVNVVNREVFVYVAKSIRDNSHKIGVSRDIVKREIGLKKKNKPVKMLFYFKGGYSKESELHLHFKDKRLTGEWFNLTNADIEYIKSTNEITEA